MMRTLLRTKANLKLPLRAITVVVLAFLAPGVAADAQDKTAKVYRLGFLANVPPTTPEIARNFSAFFQGLRDLGYVEGQNLIVERRYAEGQPARWPGLASELVGLKLDVIVANTTPAVVAIKKASGTIPIVIPVAIDPVGAGLATSLARPGGTVTGLSQASPEMNAKALAFLKEAIPRISRLAVLWNSANPGNQSVWKTPSRQLVQWGSHCRATTSAALTTSSVPSLR